MAIVAVILNACAGAPPLPRQHVLDTQLGYMREYELVDPQTLQFQYKYSHVMDWGKNTYGNGFVCAPMNEVAPWLEYCRNNKEKCGIK